jgi:hypothetical protein
MFDTLPVEIDQMIIGILPIHTQYLCRQTCAQWRASLPSQTRSSSRNYCMIQRVIMDGSVNIMRYLNVHFKYPRTSELLGIAIQNDDLPMVCYMYDHKCKMPGELVESVFTYCSIPTMECLNNLYDFVSYAKIIMVSNMAQLDWMLSKNCQITSDDWIAFCHKKNHKILARLYNLGFPKTIHWAEAVISNDGDVYLMRLLISVGYEIDDKALDLFINPRYYDLLVECQQYTIEGSEKQRMCCTYLMNCMQSCA